MLARHLFACRCARTHATFMRVASAPPPHVARVAYRCRVDEVASAFEHGIPALEGMAARRERCAKDGFTGDTPMILVDALSEFPLTTEDHGLERPDLHRLHALAARGAVRLRVLFWYVLGRHPCCPRQRALTCDPAGTWTLMNAWRQQKPPPGCFLLSALTKARWQTPSV